MIFSKKKYQIKEEDRQFLDYIPPVSILLGGFIFIFGTVLAIFMYETQKGGYQFLTQYFSELGLRNDYLANIGDGTQEMRYAPQYPNIFNVSLFAAGFLMIPFFLFSYRQMRNNNRLSNFFLLLATFNGMVTGPMLVGVGIFDLSTKSDVIWMTHGFWVAWLYLLISTTSFFWLIMLITANNLPYRTTKWIIVDYTFLSSLAFLTIVNIVDALNIIKVEDIPYLDVLPIQTYQKIIAYLFFLYYGMIVGVRLTKTKYDNTPVIHKPTNKSKEIALPPCIQCGTKNPIGTSFCSDCGVKLL